MNVAIVVLDACVLFPAALRDTLLRAAKARLYQPRWSADILEEVRRNLVEKGNQPDLVQRLINILKEVFAGATVTGYQHLIATMPNDPKDRHVLAAAVVAEAGIIVTDNLRDFPAEALAPFQIVAQSPDDFLMSLFSAHSDVMTQIIVEQAADLHRPPQTPHDVLDKLALQAPIFAARLREVLSE
jgi:predicted nucleic acid-binding protein